MARFVVEYQYPEGPRREVYVTSESTPALTGAPLHDGDELSFRGRRWKVTLLRGSVDRYVLTPARGRRPACPRFEATRRPGNTRIVIDTGRNRG